MQKILSKYECTDVILQALSKDWDRVDRYGKYHQVFIEDPSLELKLEQYFGREFLSPPILKVVRFNVGDNIPLFSADYSRTVDEYYKRYIDTNFIIQVYLNADIEGGRLSLGNHTFDPLEGFGIIQNKTDKCSISIIEKGTLYMLFCFIKSIKTNTIL